MSSKMVKIAIAQMSSGESKENNVKRSLSMLDTAVERESDLVVFPEYQMISRDYLEREAILENSEEDEGRYVKVFMEYAKKNSINILCNMAENFPGSAKPYNASILINRSGYMVGKYRKIHLFDALGKGESYAYSAGLQAPAPYILPEFRIGVQICFDLRFPETARILAVQGIDILVYQAGWFSGEHKLEQWRTLLRARAIENGAFVIGAAQCGQNYTGHSMIVSPYGDILEEAENQETVLISDIDLSEVDIYREEMPIIRFRRLDLYDIKGL